MPRSWASSTDASLFVSHDVGTSWTRLGTVPAPAVEPSAADIGVLFAHGNGSATIYTSRYGGVSFASVTIPGMDIRAVAPDPAVSTAALVFGLEPPLSASPGRAILRGLRVHGSGGDVAHPGIILFRVHDGGRASTRHRLRGNLQRDRDRQNLRHRQKPGRRPHLGERWRRRSHDFLNRQRIPPNPASRTPSRPMVSSFGPTPGGCSRSELPDPCNGDVPSRRSSTPLLHSASAAQDAVIQRADHRAARSHGFPE